LKQKIIFMPCDVNWEKLINDDGCFAYRGRSSLQMQLRADSTLIERVVAGYWQSPGVMGVRCNLFA
jgi:hypothetical protein